MQRQNRKTAEPWAKSCISADFAAPQNKIACRKVSRRTEWQKVRLLFVKRAGFTEHDATETAAVPCYNVLTGGGEMPLKQTVYVDVLMAVNFFINYFLLLACAKFLTVPVKRGRLALASGLGAAFSLSLLLPEIPAVLALVVKLAMSAAIVLCAFGFGGAKQLLRCTAAFYIINFGFAGLMMALWYFFAPQGLVIRNSVVYFNISPVLLILLTIVCYLAITGINRIVGRQAPKELSCRVVITRGGIACDCTAKVDTGNSLREPFSDVPVIVADKEVIKRLIPPDGSLNFRLVPYEAVSGSGVLKAFRPDHVTVYCGKRVLQVQQVYIAVSEVKLGGCDALVNPDILQTPG